MRWGACVACHNVACVCHTVARVVCHNVTCVCHTVARVACHDVTCVCHNVACVCHNVACTCHNVLGGHDGVRGAAAQPHAISRIQRGLFRFCNSVWIAVAAHARAAVLGPQYDLFRGARKAIGVSKRNSVPSRCAVVVWLLALRC